MSHELALYFGQSALMEAMMLGGPLLAAALVVGTYEERGGSHGRSYINGRGCGLCASAAGEAQDAAVQTSYPTDCHFE